MIYPPIFQLASASLTVKSLLGANPVRFYPFGEAPQNVAAPYAVWQTISGFPENYIGDRPDADSWTSQIDVYAQTASSARQVAAALRDALEGHGQVVRWNGELKDSATSLYRFSFDVDLVTLR